MRTAIAKARLVAATLLAGLAACSASTPSGSPPGDGAAEARSTQDASGGGRPARGLPAETATRAEGTTPQREGHRVETAADGVRVRLAPSCVQPGATLELRIDAGTSVASIGYLAWYAGENSGSEPPFGDGYGGNGGGMPDDDGVYTDSWAVSRTAPLGSGRVDVTILFPGSGGRPTRQRELSLPFRVATAEACRAHADL